ncbi:YjhX family toxin [Pelagibacterium mangrovi]|uniref:YjhX family toxin n=1 Tax=Pelagibacterium mangrovi TaxID=3119828 RepID=UPI002FC6670D
MDISRQEQRVLHALAQGGYIHPIKDTRGKIADIECYTRDGWLLTQCDMALFKKLRRRKTIVSRNGGAYRITRRGIELVRSQVDNR